jgi:hypothetical protein
MLQQGIICGSSLAFSSLVLLVKKHGDPSGIEIKMVHMIPILVVDRRLDVLCGSRFFSKLNLRSGYDQVLMNEVDIEKTVFQTHHDHFEFLVMLFGLTNAL